MRLFIALPVSNEAKEKFMEIQRKMIAAADSSLIKWTEKNQCHVTVEFLGEISENKVSELSSIIGSMAGQFKQFNFSFKSPGAFPGWDSPNVLVLHLNDENNAAAFQSRLNRELRAKKIVENNRPWKPHLTFGRVKEKILVPEEWKNLALPNVSWTADRVELIESRLLPSGSEYRVLGEFPFGG